PTKSLMDSPSSSRGLSCEYHLVRSHKSPKKKRAAQISKPLENDRGRRHGWKLRNGIPLSSGRSSSISATMPTSESSALLILKKGWVVPASHQGCDAHEAN